jgi:hypothetical protein
VVEDLTSFSHALAVLFVFFQVWDTVLLLSFARGFSLLVNREGTRAHTELLVGCAVQGKGRTSIKPTRPAWKDTLGIEPPMTRVWISEWLEYNKKKWALQREARAGKLATFSPKFTIPRAEPSTDGVGVTRKASFGALVVFDSSSDEYSSEDELPSQLPSVGEGDGAVTGRNRTFSEEGRDFRVKTSELAARLKQLTSTDFDS